MVESLLSASLKDLTGLLQSHLSWSNIRLTPTSGILRKITDIRQSSLLGLFHESWQRLKCFYRNLKRVTDLYERLKNVVKYQKVSIMLSTARCLATECSIQIIEFAELSLIH